MYVLICCWWFSTKATSKVGVHELGNWLSFWHFCVRQWGGFMVHVNEYFISHLFMTFCFLFALNIVIPFDI
jgi:hypothetical protein